MSITGLKAEHGFSFREQKQFLSYQQKINYIGRSHLVYGMNLAKQNEIFSRLNYDCAPRAKPPILPDEATIEKVLAAIREVFRSTPVKGNTE